jgi:hypothetical protein
MEARKKEQRQLEDVKKLFTEKQNILQKNDWAVFIGLLEDRLGPSASCFISKKL